MAGINKVVKILIYSDFFLNSAWGLLAPVFAIFIIQNIQGGDAKVAGFAAMTYWIAKSLLQIPIGKYLDRNHGEKDDFIFVFFGTLLSGLVPFGFLLASSPWHLYGLQIFHAVGMAMALPAWSAIFTRHIDKGHEAFEWGLDSTSLGFGAGIAGAAGGLLVAAFGFSVVLILVGALTIISAVLLVLIRDEISPKDKKIPHIPMRAPT